MSVGLVQEEAACLWINWPLLATQPLNYVHSALDVLPQGLFLAECPSLTTYGSKGAWKRNLMKCTDDA